MLPSATTGALKQRAAWILFALILNPCVGPCETQYALDIRSKKDIARAPFAVNADGFKWSVGAFKPRDLITGEKLDFQKGDKRLALRGKGVGLNNFIEFGGIDGRGRFSLGATLALDDSKGLRDGVTQTWVYARYLDGGTPVNYQINLGYSAALDDGKGLVPGWVARAYQDATLLDEIEYPNVSSLDLRLIQYADRLEFLARPTPAMPYGGEPEELESFDEIHEEMMLPADAFEVGFGAFGIDKKGEVYLDTFWFMGPDLGPAPGSDELVVFDAFGLIGSCLDLAKQILADPEVDLADIQDAKDEIDFALGAAINTMFTLEAGLGAGDFDPQTQAKLARKAAKQTYKKLMKASNKLGTMLDKAKVNSKALKKICNCLESLVDRSAVGMANMLGVKAKSFKQLDLGYAIPEGEIPDIF